jgi:hypothetical protein
MESTATGRVHMLAPRTLPAMGFRGIKIQSSSQPPDHAGKVARVLSGTDKWIMGASTSSTDFTLPNAHGPVIRA